MRRSLLREACLINSNLSPVLSMKRTIVILSGILVAVILLTFGSGLSGRSTRATPSERASGLPGDNLIPNPIKQVDHAITIRRSPHDVWPLLAQMGSDRAGWYAYDFIDNGGHHSAERILPEFQSIGVGTVFPALPGAKDVFVVVQCEPEHNLVLSFQSRGGTYYSSWEFVLEQPQPNVTRLVVRGRVGPEYHPWGLPLWITKLVGPPIHFIMQRKQLLGIARRAESTLEGR